jgi:DNA-binding CsgD family transcriptional regulator
MIIGELAEIIAIPAPDADVWSAFARRFSELVPGTKILFMANDRVADCDIPLVQFGFDKGLIAEFATHYGNRNPWAPFNRQLRSLIPERTEQRLPASSFKHTEFYNDFLPRIGESDAATAMKIWNGDQRNAEFIVHYAAARDTRLNTLLDPVLKALGPVMSEAFASLRIRMDRERADRRTAMVEAMVDPAFVVAKNGKVLAVNAAGEALAREAELVRIAAGDKLEVLSTAAAQAVAEAIATVVRGDRLAAGSELTRLGAPGRTHTITVYPMMAHLGAGFGLLSPSEACVLLIVRPLLQAAAQPVELLRERFGLTAAEARLALKLMGGGSLPEVSKALGISYLTGRSQLKSIFAKVNVRRQSELVATLLSCCGWML